MIKDMESNINPKERYKPVYIGITNIICACYCLYNWWYKRRLFTFNLFTYYFICLLLGAIGGLIVGVLSGFLLVTTHGCSKRNKPKYHKLGL